MSLAATLVSGLAEPVTGLIDDLFTSDEEREKAKRLLESERGQRALKNMELQLSAIMAEAESDDPWTSRARPTFLYLIYLVILMCVVGGIVGIWWPTEVTIAASNIRDLLNAIPESLWWLFGTGYLGYTGARSLDKMQRAKGKGGIFKR